MTKTIPLKLGCGDLWLVEPSRELFLCREPMEDLFPAIKSQPSGAALTFTVSTKPSTGSKAVHVVREHEKRGGFFLWTRKGIKEDYLYNNARRVLDEMFPKAWPFKRVRLYVNLVVDKPATLK
jgi:hypothetical protein